MRKTTSLLLAFGAGLAAYNWFDHRRRGAKARAWRSHPPKTALVTGASSGIGAAFARALARDGYRLVLLARREERLRALAEEIQRECPVEVEILVADLDSPADLERVERYVEGMDNLDLLVNNAGFGIAGEYAAMDGEDAQGMVRLMILAGMRLARAALPGMIARGHGALINVSSLASFMPAWGNSVYGATKAYLNFFSEALAEELAGTGVRVQALCPGFTRTEIHDRSGRPKLPPFFWMSADYVVAESLRGLREGRLYVIPGPGYHAAVTLTRMPLVGAFIRAARSLMRGPLKRAHQEMGRPVLVRQPASRPPAARQ